ncbi:uncharacterized protein [Choristoneura fumiferana]|uniref:uncharacterized protein n=1 Tax=Choristoneura fumiferana TaxID=7141 RepID=UPI003D15A304
MDNRSYKELTAVLFILSFGTTFSASIFGLNLGSLKDAAVNNIEHVPKFLHRVNLFNHHTQSERDNPTAFQDNRENVENERKSFPYILNPTKYENQQNWGLNDPTSFPNNQGNTAYNGYKTTITPLPNKYSQRQELDSDSPISFGDNGWSTDYNGYNNANTFNPTTNKEQQRSSFAPTTSHFNNKVTPGNNLNYAGSPVNINSRGSFYDGVENTKLLLPDNDKKRNPADEYLSDYADEFSTDYTTTTDNEWTTTDEPLNRIGAPPAVVASILG